MKEPFEGWAIIELFGHNMIAGKVTEQTIGGSSFVRVDVPAEDGSIAYTKFFGGSAIYAITPTDEHAARQAAANLGVRPVVAWVVPDGRRELPGPVVEQPAEPMAKPYDIDDDF